MIPAATYVYCIVSSPQPLSTTGTPPGPPGTGAIRLLEIRPKRYAVVSDAPVIDFGARPLAAHLADLDWVSRAAVAHEAVVGSFMTKADAVVPMKLFTLFNNDARAVEELRSGWTRIERVVRKLAKHEEWGVRLVYDVSRAAPTDGGVANARTGRSYLLAKRRERTAASARSRTMRTAASDVLKTVRRLARDTRRREVTVEPDSRSRLLLDVALLVPRSRAERFQATVAREAKKIAPAGYVLQLTGPWPAYSFTDNP